jgi:hypothetical protein
MHEHQATFVKTFQFTYPERNGYHMLKDRGIHIYFMDDNNNDLGYYTPMLEVLCIFEKPRQVSPRLLEKGEIKHD